MSEREQWIGDYRVTWSGDFSAASPVEAARQAEAYMQKFVRTHGPRVFHVTPHREGALTMIVDLNAPETAE